MSLLPRTTALLVGGLLLASARADAPPQQLTPAQREEMDKEAKGLIAEIDKLTQARRYADAAQRQERLIAIFRQFYPPEKYPDGHSDLAAAVNNLGYMLASTGEFEKARSCYERVLAMRRQLYPPAKYPNGHPDLAASLARLGNLLQSMTEYERALPFLEQALAMRRRLYPVEKYPSGHALIFDSLNDLGDLHQSMGRYQKALPCYEEALAMGKRICPPDRFPNGCGDLVASFNRLGTLLQVMGDYEKALPCFEQALTMCRTLYPPQKYPDGHPELAAILTDVGNVLQAKGEHEKALLCLEQALTMRQKLYPPSEFPDGQPDVAASFANVGSMLHAMGEYEKALKYVEQGLAMQRKLYPPEKYPDGHVELAGTLNILGGLLETMGEFDKALPCFEETLAIRRKRYPPEKYPAGHPYLATSISNLAGVLESMSAYEKALPYYEQAVGMLQKCYPPETYPSGHPYLAISLTNLGHTHHLSGDFGKALLNYDQALAMFRKLYPPDKFPAGHPDLAAGLNNEGVLLHEMGKSKQAIAYLDQALVMREKLYPEARYPVGHPLLADSIAAYAQLLSYTGADARSLSYFESALAMYQAQLQIQAAAVPEGNALALARRPDVVRDTYLSASHRVPGTAEGTYARVWTSKAALTRVLERRHAAARVALVAARSGTDISRQWDEITAVRRQIARLLLDPGGDLAARDRKLSEVTDRKDRLERELARHLPDVVRQAANYRLTPDDLARQLPARTTFIDLLWFVNEEAGHEPGKNGVRRINHYVAFVVAPGRPVVRVELGEAGSLDQVVTDWRTAIQRNLNYDDDKLQELRRVFWEEIANHLPADTQTVYLAPDGNLARLPWAALPGSKAGTVLSEEYSFAVVPHGPFLLEQLMHPPSAADPAGGVLTLGGVPYGTRAPSSTRSYGDLKGTAREQMQIQALAGHRSITPLSGPAATAARLLAELPKARFAHLATHGFFDEGRLTEEHRRQRAELERLRRGYTFSEGRNLPRVGLGTRSPLAYTGLVLAGANNPATAGPEGGIVTGEQLVQLPLERLELAVLSACETGLGELTGGEGVQGLVRAFHLAGCPTVVASLWSVDDNATAALMTVFYDGLWSKGKTPLEALRRAQLAIYHHPELIAALAGDEGEVKTAALATADAPSAGRRRTPVRQWAAFVLSGTGR
jgi:tetratricopeptide (TPR) repeat protein/CHAT domain-containing protein